MVEIHIPRQNYCCWLWYILAHLMLNYFVEVDYNEWFCFTEPYQVGFLLKLLVTCYFTFHSRIPSFYNTLHLFFLLILGTGHKTALMASSKTVFNPF